MILIENSGRILLIEFIDGFCIDIIRGLFAVLKHANYTESLIAFFLNGDIMQ